MASETQLYLQDVHRSFDGYKAINGLSPRHRQGRAPRPVVGPNGAGKTTMLDIITGKTRPDTGRVGLGRGHRPHAPRRDRYRPPRHWPQVPEADRLRDLDRVEANLMLALAGQRGVAATLLHKLSGGERKRITELLELVRLERRGATASPAASATARSSGWRSACCWRRIRR